MKTLTEEEILEKHYKAYKKRIAYPDHIFNAMQEFSDRENARLTAINLKQAELIKHLLPFTERCTIEETYKSEYQKWYNKRKQLESDIATLQSVKEADYLDYGTQQDRFQVNEDE